MQEVPGPNPFGDITFFRNKICSTVTSIIDIIVLLFIHSIMIILLFVFCFDWLNSASLLFDS